MGMIWNKDITATNSAATRIPQGRVERDANKTEAGTGLKLSGSLSQKDKSVIEQKISQTNIETLKSGGKITVQLPDQGGKYVIDYKKDPNGEGALIVSHEKGEGAHKGSAATARMILNETMKQIAHEKGNPGKPYSPDNNKISGDTIYRIATKSDEKNLMGNSMVHLSKAVTPKDTEEKPYLKALQGYQPGESGNKISQETLGKIFSEIDADPKIKDKETEKRDFIKSNLRLDHLSVEESSQPSVKNVPSSVVGYVGSDQVKGGFGTANTPALTPPIKAPDNLGARGQGTNSSMWSIASSNEGVYRDPNGGEGVPKMMNGSHFSVVAVKDPAGNTVDKFPISFERGTESITKFSDEGDRGGVLGGDDNKLKRLLTNPSYQNAKQYLAKYPGGEYSTELKALVQNHEGEIRKYGKSKTGAS